MIINCYFCQQEISDAALLSSETRYAPCRFCPHTCITTVRDGKIQVATIHFDYRKRAFRADFSINMPFPDFMLTEITQYIGEPDREGMTVLRTVLKLPFLPQDITPDNIIDKLPTLLVFS